MQHAIQRAREGVRVSAIDSEVAERAAAARYMKRRMETRRMRLSEEYGCMWAVGMVSRRVRGVGRAGCAIAHRHASCVQGPRARAEERVCVVVGRRSEALGSAGGGRMYTAQRADAQLGGGACSERRG